MHLTYSAQLTTANEDAALVQHTGVEMQHVVDINCYKILCQISLGREKNHFSLMILQNQVSLRKNQPKKKTQTKEILSFYCVTSSTWLNKRKQDFILWQRPF